MDAFFFLAAIMIIALVLRSVINAPKSAFGPPMRCNLKRQPHDWKEHVQPGFEHLEKPPIYLQCDTCGYIFGQE
jgi:hypothetical protein